MRWYPVFLVCSAILAFSAAGCKHSSHSDPVDPGQHVDSCGYNTGRLSVQVRQPNSTTMESGAEIFVYIDHDDLVNNRYLSYAVTGSGGWIDLGCYNYGNYYVRAQKNIGGVVWFGEEPVQVQVGRGFTLTVEIYKP